MDSEWQKIVEKFDAEHGDLPADFGILSPQAGAAVFEQEQQSPPMQSIEPTTSVSEAELQQMSGTSGHLLSFPYVPPHHQQHQHCEPWSAPSTNNPPHGWPMLVPHDDQAYLMSNAYPLEPVQYEPAYPPMHAHHAIGGPSPMLSQGSPFHDDFMDGVYDQPDIPAYALDSSGSDELNELDAADPCYAQLLYRCLKEAPDHTLSLRELYDWVREHSQKAKDPKQRGWQNSVRHNLSMNAAFERVPPSQVHGVKKGSLWRLTPHALREGVISTTRYRKDPKRKSDRRGSPALKRQISGAKGGQATRNATRRQQALREMRSFPTLANRHNQLRRNHHLPGRRHETPPHGWLGGMPIYSHHPSPQYMATAPQPPPSPYFLEMEDSAAHPTSMPMSAPHTPPQMQLMYDSQPKCGIQDFGLGHLDFGNGNVVREHDEFGPETPSLATEASFMSDEAAAQYHQQQQQWSREPTSFPVEV
ncbi:hypothetical protein EJ03DRAFT_371279 [Teratosphaeria nubilosa]|uniref:Fork-head domain-containing protein n=1 Tax=Teratosphaeria nubilosa TaxID=161662 RepID=A0A6G1LLB5_9PEZI|nr:hypothetical protein EJ03DRAFT_371279 [Teratosphaeria nubilosa]